jgi:hypothetical protein
MSETYQLIGAVVGVLPWVSTVVIVVSAALLGWKYSQTRLSWLRPIVIGLALQVLAFVMIFAWSNYYWLITGPQSSFTEEILARASVIDVSVTFCNQLFTIVGIALMAYGAYQGVRHQYSYETDETEDEIKHEEEFQSVDGFDPAREQATVTETIPVNEITKGE